jgi:hypothetical protein
MVLCGLGDQGISVQCSVGSRDLFLHGSQKQVWGPPGLVKMDTRAFPSDKQMRPEADHLPPPSTQVNACNCMSNIVFLVPIGASFPLYHYTICSYERREFLEISQKDLSMVQMP